MVSAEARKNLELHIEAERRHDMEGIVAPLSDDASFIVDSMIFEGKDAIRSMYERGLDQLTSERQDEYLQALDDPEVTKWGPTHCVIEYSDKYPLHKNLVVIVHFDEQGKVKSENTYYRGGYPPKH